MSQEPIRSVAEAEEVSSPQQSRLDLPHPEITDEAVSFPTCRCASGSSRLFER